MYTQNKTNVADLLTFIYFYA